MESRIGEVRKVHVVYFLSRGGQVEHPHLIKVQQTALNGLRLKDVKRWLSKLRGDDMPDSFSWSYKRKYKSSYVWQDLRDDDLITPICDSEYVLKGSEILPTRDSCRCSCDRQTPEPDRLLPEDLQSSDEQPEDSNLMFELDSPLRQKIYEDLQRCSEEVPFKELSGLKGLQNVDKCEDSGKSGEYSAKITISNKPPKSPNDTDEGVRVYKAVSSASTGPKLDAASQTGESQRLFSDGQGVSSLLDGARKVNDESLEKISAPNAPEKLPNSLLSLARNDTTLSTCENTKFPPKESRQGRTRPTLASHVLKQLFRCGGLDTNDSRIHSIKALPSVKLGRRSNVNSDNSRSSTPPKKAETQTDLTKSNSVPDLQTLPEKSVFEKSDSKNFNGSSHKPIDSKREVNYTQNSSKSSHSLSSSSGEIAEKNVVGIQTPDVDCCNRNNGKPQISADSPAKVPQSPVTLWTNVKDEISPLLNPKTISKCSPKIEAPAVLSKDVETNCIKPDDRANRQNTRSKRRIRNILTK